LTQEENRNPPLSEAVDQFRKRNNRLGLMLAGLRLGTRSFFRRTLLPLLTALALTGCGGHGVKWHSTDITGSFPALKFSMTRAPDGKPVTQADYRGKVVMLYFGYTFCPDICPTTLANAASILRKLGSNAAQVRMLFVTVDPHRDTLPVLASYVKNFAPQIEGLRGSPDEIAALARRYRVAYSVTPSSKGHPYEVTHSPAIYVFDETGAVRLLVSLRQPSPKLDAGVVADLKRLVNGG
jgi:protein SCO1